MVGRSLRGYLIVVAVFLLGAVAGGAAVFAVLRERHMAHLLDDRTDERRLEVMTKQLSLDATQRERIASLLNDARREAKAIALETDARCGHPLIDHRAKVDQGIRAELRGPQQVRFDELLARLRAREAAAPTP
jgi:hypothetical protein